MSDSDKMATALEFARYQSTINNQIDILRTKFNSDILVAENGGLFTVSLDFLNSLKLVIDEGLNDIVLIDNNDNPVFVTNLYQFYKKSLEIYKESSDEFYREFSKLTKTRNMNEILGV